VRKILIIEDEPDISDLLVMNLRREYEVQTAYDGQEGIYKYGTFKPELILLDLMLPQLSGFEVLSKIRENDKQTSVIMLTAKAEEEDKLTGFELGADDYIPKPFSNAELKSRIKANLRRVPEKPDELADGRETISLDENILDAKLAGKPCGLTPREYELLKCLANNNGKVLTREELLRDVWKYKYFGDARAVDVAIRRLREKIEPDPENPKYIITKRGIGYYFTQNEDA